MNRLASTRKTENYLHNPRDLLSYKLAKCRVCKDHSTKSPMLACRMCSVSYHSICVGLNDMPGGDWYCCTECYDIHHRGITRPQIPSWLGKRGVYQYNNVKRPHDDTFSVTCMKYSSKPAKRKSTNIYATHFPLHSISSPREKKSHSSKGHEEKCNSQNPIEELKEEYSGSIAGVERQITRVSQESSSNLNSIKKSEIEIAIDTDDEEEGEIREEEGKEDDFDDNHINRVQAEVHVDSCITIRSLDVSPVSKAEPNNELHHSIRKAKNATEYSLEDQEESFSSDILVVFQECLNDIIDKICTATVKNQKKLNVRELVPIMASENIDLDQCQTFERNTPLEDNDPPIGNIAQVSEGEYLYVDSPNLDIASMDATGQQIQFPVDKSIKLPMIVDDENGIVRVNLSETKTPISLEMMDFLKQHLDIPRVTLIVRPQAREFSIRQWLWIYVQCRCKHRYIREFQYWYREGASASSVFKGPISLSINIDSFVRYLGMRSKNSEWSEDEKEELMVARQRNGQEVEVKTRSDLIQLVSFPVFDYCPELRNIVRLYDGALEVPSLSEFSNSPSMSNKLLLHVSPNYNSSTKRGLLNWDSLYDTTEQCLDGQNVYTVLKRVSRKEYSDAISVLKNSSSNSSLTMLKLAGFSPSRFRLRPGEIVHINKGRPYFVEPLRICSDNECDVSIRAAWQYVYIGHSEGGVKQEFKYLLDHCEDKEVLLQGLLEVIRIASISEFRLMNQLKFTSFKALEEPLLHWIKEEKQYYEEYKIGQYDKSFEKAIEESENFHPDTMILANEFVDSLGVTQPERIICEICRKYIVNGYLRSVGCALHRCVFVNICFQCSKGSLWGLKHKLNELSDLGRLWKNKVTTDDICQCSASRFCKKIAECEKCNCNCHATYHLRYRLASVPYLNFLLHNVKAV